MTALTYTRPMHFLSVDNHFVIITLKGLQNPCYSPNSVDDIILLFSLLKIEPRTSWVLGELPPNHIYMMTFASVFNFLFCDFQSQSSWCQGKEEPYSLFYLFIFLMVVTVNLELLKRPNLQCYLNSLPKETIHLTNIFKIDDKKLSLVCLFV